MFVGHLYFNITGLAVFQGMATSLDTFCSQAYGSGNKKMVGYFQRATLLMLATMVPLMLVWWYSGSILNQLVPDPELVSMAQFFLRIHAFGVPGLILFESGKRFYRHNTSSKPVHMCWLLHFHLTCY